MEFELALAITTRRLPPTPVNLFNVSKFSFCIMLKDLKNNLWKTPGLDPKWVLENLDLRSNTACHHLYIWPKYVQKNKNKKQTLKKDKKK